MCGKIRAGPAGVDELLRLVEAVGSPEQRCNEISDAGGQGGSYKRHELGRGGPTSFVLRYQTFQVKDRVTVIYEGKEIFNSGFVGTGGDVFRRIDLPPGVSTSVLVRIDAPENGTEWNYTVGCPG